MKIYTTDCQKDADDDRETTGLHVPLPNNNSAKNDLYPSPTKLVGVGVWGYRGIYDLPCFRSEILN